MPTSATPKATHSRSAPKPAARKATATPKKKVPAENARAAQTPIANPHAGTKMAAAAAIGMTATLIAGRLLLHSRRPRRGIRRIVKSVASAAERLEKTSGEVTAISGRAKRVAQVLAE